MVLKKYHYIQRDVKKGPFKKLYVHYVAIMSAKGDKLTLPKKKRSLLKTCSEIQKIFSIID